MAPLRFEKVHISDERYESCGVFDVDNNGVLDIVSGAFWYPGPTFDKKLPIGEVEAIGEYYDDFSTIPMDVNGNGYLDFITGGWWGATLRWRENPQGDPTAQWPLHDIAECGNIETTRAWDVDGDGELEIVPNTPGGPQRIYKRVGPGEFKEHVISDGPSGHGLGFGDITGNGRGDIVLARGWLEAPETPLESTWVFHEDFDLGSASVPIIVTDVNGDGLADLIVGQSHAYGLDWWEQSLDGGKRTWTRHAIDPFNSQYHDMWWGDIDGDGENELVTGCRYRAHNGNDPGSYDPYGIYYFKWTGEGFAKIPIEFGPIRRTKGCGISFQIADLDGNGKLDIICPGKDGLAVYRNIGVAEKMEP